MKFGVVTFPGSNCDQDMVYAWETLLGQEVVKLWHKDRDLQGVDMVILPGGFSYGDYLRSGAIARFSPIMEEVIKFANNGGYVLGVCNGFQVLTETHLLPGALMHNTSHKFICKNVYLKPESKKAVMTSNLEDRAYKIPIAHGEGNYYADEETLKMLNDKDLIMFRYCDENGVVNEESNPNGSLQNIAGICNEGGNVFGMMPHPERAMDENLGNLDGFQMMKNILSLMKEA